MSALQGSLNCPVAGCTYIAKPNSKDPRGSLLSHISRKRKSHCQAHLDFDYASDPTCHYQPKITKKQLQLLSPAERRARELELHKLAQGKLREKNRLNAVRLAAELGDPSLATQLDKSSITRRRSDTKRKATKRCRRTATDPLFASSDMGHLLCFYLHFFLDIAIRPDLDSLDTGAKVDELLAALWKVFPEGTSLYNELNRLQVVGEPSHNLGRPSLLSVIRERHYPDMMLNWVDNDGLIFDSSHTNHQLMPFHVIQKLNDDIDHFCSLLSRNRECVAQSDAEMHRLSQSIAVDAISQRAIVRERFSILENSIWAKQASKNMGDSMPDNLRQKLQEMELAWKGGQKETQYGDDENGLLGDSTQEGVGGESSCSTMRDDSECQHEPEDDNTELQHPELQHEHTVEDDSDDSANTEPQHPEFQHEPTGGNDSDGSANTELQHLDFQHAPAGEDHDDTDDSSNNEPKERGFQHELEDGNDYSADGNAGGVSNEPISGDDENPRTGQVVEPQEVVPRSRLRPPSLSSLSASPRSNTPRHLQILQLDKLPPPIPIPWTPTSRNRFSPNSPPPLATVVTLSYDDRENDSRSLTPTPLCPAQRQSLAPTSLTPQPRQSVHHSAPSSQSSATLFSSEETSVRTAVKPAQKRKRMMRMPDINQKENPAKRITRGRLPKKLEGYVLY